jgi:SAM-dependent methyltransferase
MSFILGNAAKRYCLEWVQRYAQRHPEALTLLDLGCGNAHYAVHLLQACPNIHFVGIEPDAAECRRAEENLKGLHATIVHGYAYDPIRSRLPYPAFDLMLSFSVLEHVYERAAYLQLIHDCLKPEGSALINYDSGHFFSTYWKERVKNLVGPLLARAGNQGYYQAFVHEADFQGWAREAGLVVRDAKMFNMASLKGAYKSVPETLREDYLQRWLSLELWLNENSTPYTDASAASWHTRNFILQRAK